MRHYETNCRGMVVLLAVCKGALANLNPVRHPLYSKITHPGSECHCFSMK